tara:strand:- start:48 stop:224 length:177 start_codon:yes stop_codon:yes gene_type:complete
MQNDRARRNFASVSQSRRSTGSGCFGAMGRRAAERQQADAAEAADQVRIGHGPIGPGP